MKVKIENVIIGRYNYDSIITKIDGKKVEVVFNKRDNVEQYEGKEVDLVCDNGKYSISKSNHNEKSSEKK